jgi:hypothetical protein
MVMSPAGLGTKNDCAGDGQEKFSGRSVSQSVASQSPTNKDVVAEEEESTLLAAAA